uniref:Uncharacterized protein n=1 Tax=Chlamydomonas euryale TaxID=1486919 RepID=A0A7R9VDK9_9CHLO|mmetsp:Transcript_31438/g.93786  ORF Transcript_31438/g.93786 Transcript_31438/m.93786 type:complete len:182 (+) Transcript_31438:420-965(+)
MAVRSSTAGTATAAARALLLGQAAACSCFASAAAMPAACGSSLRPNSESPCGSAVRQFHVATPCGSATRLHAPAPGAGSTGGTCGMLVRLATARSFSSSDGPTILDGLVNWEQRGVPRGAGVGGASGFDLTCMRQLLSRLGDPHKRVRAVHVAGSKGAPRHVRRLDVGQAIGTHARATARA